MWYDYNETTVNDRPNDQMTQESTNIRYGEEVLPVSFDVSEMCYDHY